MIVLPMMGESKRFKEAGYAAPKWTLPIADRPVLEYVVAGFSRAFASEPFIFIAPAESSSLDLIPEVCDRLGVARHLLYTLSSKTTGQADTVRVALQQAFDAGDVVDSDHVWIFNVDTIRLSRSLPELPEICDGWLEFTRAEGDGWSFVHGPLGKLTGVTEKAQPNGRACTGLYYWKSAQAFLRAFRDSCAGGQALAQGESYVAPLYNQLIARDATVQAGEVPAESIRFCGVPSEYVECLAMEIELRRWLDLG